MPQSGNGQIEFKELNAQMRQQVSTHPKAAKTQKRASTLLRKSSDRSRAMHSKVEGLNAAGNVTSNAAGNANGNVTSNGEGNRASNVASLASQISDEELGSIRAENSKSRPEVKSEEGKSSSEVNREEGKSRPEVNREEGKSSSEVSREEGKSRPEVNREEAMSRAEISREVEPPLEPDSLVISVHVLMHTRHARKHAKGSCTHGSA